MKIALKKTANVLVLSTVLFGAGVPKTTWAGCHLHPNSNIVYSSLISSTLIFLFPFCFSTSLVAKREANKLLKETQIYQETGIISSPLSQKVKIYQKIMSEKGIEKSDDQAIVDFQEILTNLSFKQ